MAAIRHVEQVTGKKLVLDLPVSLQGKRVEVIVQELPSQKPLAKKSSSRRQPPAALAGKMTVHDDLIASVVKEID